MRAAFLAVLLAFAGHIAEARPETSKARVVALEEPRPFSWLLPKGRTASGRQTALAGRVARQTLLFVDVDRDGRFDEPNVDGWAIEGRGRYLAPFRDPLIVDRAMVRVSVDAEKKTIAWSAEPIKAPRDHLYTIVDMNELRMQNGLPPVAYSAELSKACEAHCAYMDRHGITHYQRKGKAGYTPEGAKSGRNGNIATGDDLDRVARDSLATFFHRRTLMEPDTTHFGLGVGKKHVILDGLSLRKPVRWRYPIIVPAPSSGASVPVGFNHTEVPSPVPQSPPAGFPITLRWPPGTRIKNVKAALRTKRKKKVAAYVSWMEKPAHASIPHNQFSICIIPKRALKEGTDYRVEVKAEIDGKPYETSFTFHTEGFRKR